MQKLKYVVAVLGIVATTTLPIVHAESAPVYDADNFQQQFENTGDLGQDYPPPPPVTAPNQQDVGFVPAQSVNSNMQVQPNTQNQPLVSAAVQTSSSSLSASQRLNRLEQQITTMMNSGNSARIETLQTEVQTLRGQVEQLTHQLEQLQSQQKNLYSDLDKRLLQMASSKTTETSTTKPILTDTVPEVENSHNGTEDSTPPLKPKKIVSKKIVSPVNTASEKTDQPNVAEEQQIYQTAYNLIKTKKYNDAVNTLQKMLQKYPSGQFAANAHYWLGELYGLLSKHKEALSEFVTVVNAYPNSPRVSDAQLKVGLIYASQMNWADAKSAFKKVINHYPGTASARLASQQLKQLKQAGH